MNPTRPRTLVIIAVVCAAVTWAVLGPVYNSLPPLPWTFVPALLIAAAAEAWAGRDLRARIHGRKGTRPAPPLFVARMVVLAKASSEAAAFIAGVAAGFVFYLAGSLGDPVPGHDMITAGVTLGASVVLLAAALYLEYCCRVPKAPGEQRDSEPASHRSPDR
jgi:Protein of unknown function (DUF3180)